ncbi:MAG: 1-acyl-sn-glycerol-3-phosphate acyltransferase [Leptospiraceae bacterium]|nr:1-acyl-sn-glycerol-3-phosphate acyltransferase [Leptospiraceae bacterium]
MYYFGRILGWIFMITIVKPMRIIYGKMQREDFFDKELMESLKGKSIIIVSNHIKPRNKFLKLITMPYDAYMIRNLFLNFGIKTTAFASYDGGKMKRGSKISKFKKGKERLVRGIVKSMDLIPLNRNEKDEITLKEVKKRLNRSSLGIGIFPEGSWYRGFRKSRKLYHGAGVYAKKFKLNILPVYLDAYNLKKNISLKIGELISFELSSEEITGLIGQQFKDMRKEEVYACV